MFLLFFLQSGKVGANGRSEESFHSNGREENNRPANMPLVKINGKELHLSHESSFRRCNSKGRGSVYDPVFGICCHFCRFYALPFYFLESVLWI